VKKNNPTVANLFIKPDNSQSMLTVDQAEAVAGKGLEGDRSFGHPKRQVLLVSSQVLDSLDLSPGVIRENVTTQNLDVDDLAPGTILKIGSAEFEITIPCEPCWKMDRLRSGLQTDLKGQRGVFAIVNKSGRIGIGDAIQIHSAS
jgi:MOSC domain-containing protein YiiM